MKFPPISQNRHEIRLLLFGAHAHMTADLTAQMQALLIEAPLDWDFLLKQAEFHGIVPLLYSNLKPFASDTTLIPSDIFQQLQSMSQHILMKNLYYTTELNRVLTLFAENGIRALCFKGPPLAYLLYKNLKLREFIDLDLMVDPMELEAARTLLEARGYELSIKAEPLINGRYYQGYELYHKTSLIVLDVQDRFGLRHTAFNIGFQELWEHRQIVKVGEIISVGDVNIATLSAEDYLLVLCAHGTQHRWQKLKWICDIVELIEATPLLNWAGVIQRAKAMGIERILYVGLSLAQGYFDTRLPEEVKTQIDADPEIRMLSSRVYGWLFYHAKSIRDLFERFLFDFQFDSKLRKQFRYKVSNAFFIIKHRIEPGEYDMLDTKLPRPLSFLYYFYRPLRILSQFGPHRADNSSKERHQSE